MKKIILATRGSALAMAQSEEVKNKLLKVDPELEIEFLEVVTSGDKDRKSSLSAIGGNGLFVRGIEEKLLSGEADIAVHSAKDLPYEIAEGLIIAGAPAQADCRDVIISKVPEADIKVIGTGSPRRIIEVKKQFPNAEIKEIRGNITTRVRKLREEDYDAIIIAAAGIERIDIDLSGLNVRKFDTEEFIPAACQGILAVECRKEDQEIRKLLADTTEYETMLRFEMERYLFGKLKADCSVPMGIHAEVNNYEVKLSAMFRGKYVHEECVVTDWKRVADKMVEELCLDE
ncbi:MAG: hydroxymethylbilane synthase [Lachnospiraceae bacterium]|nr:hydroxymethylbilane synthase [Lachnospiraceae bacterium]